MRAWNQAALSGAALWLLLAILGDQNVPAPWNVSSRVTSQVLLLGVLLPVLAGMMRDAVHRFGGSAYASPAPRVWPLLIALMAGNAVVNLPWLAGIYLTGLAALGTMEAIQTMKALPKQSLVTDDPLTKGDAASFKHFTFASRFLPIGMILLVAGAWASIWAPTAGYRLDAAGTHFVAIGYVLLAVYGLGHVWVPRFSGVPAIAAGAIKGELHSTMLGLLGLTIGLLTGIRGIMAGLGFFVFVGMFTYMGVLGANMMRNKSKTQRVTPEFVYIPWVFTGIFWLISAVLMGLFLNVVPDVFADQYSNLTALHASAAMIGGVVQLWLGWLTRLVSFSNALRPPRFDGAMRFGFFAFNIGLTVWLIGVFNGSLASVIGLLLVAIGVAAAGQVVLKLNPPRDMVSA